MSISQRGSRSWSVSLTVVTALVLIVFTTHIGYVGLRSYQKMIHGEALASKTQCYSRVVTNASGTILILGDSLAFGVGASSPQKSLAGQLSQRFPDYSVINKSKVGATTKELAASISREVDDRYDSAFIVIGGNDIARYGIDLDQTERGLRSIAEIAARRVDRVYLITTGDFSNVSILPWFLRPYYSDRSRRVRDAARTIDASLDNLDYVDLFDVEPLRYAQMEAKDGFHLNDLGIRQLLDAALARRASATSD